MNTAIILSGCMNHLAHKNTSGPPLSGNYESVNLPEKADYIQNIIRNLGITRKKYDIEFLNTADFSVYFQPKNAIYISDKIFSLGLAEDELAFILAHEIAHDVFLHYKRLKLSAGDKEKFELEADSFGVKIMTRAGYNIRAAVSALDKINKLFSNSQNLEDLKLRRKKLIECLD